MKDEKKKSWMSTLFAYAEGEKKRMYLSVVLSVLSVAAGLAPFYCMYAMLCLFVAGTATAAGIIKWCLLALLAYAVKILLFSLSTGVSHAMAYTILEALRLRLCELRAERRRCRTPRQVKAMDRRIRTLTPLLRQCRELAQLTEHYYERSYCRDEHYRI